MIIIIGEQNKPADCSAKDTILTPFGDFISGEIVDAPDNIAEWFIHNQLAQVARNWRGPGEKIALSPVATRVIKI